jgi:arylsulfatase A-like enzyme
VALNAAGKVIAAAAALWLCMLPFRATVYGELSTTPTQLAQLSDVPKLLLIGVYDFAFVALLALVTILALIAFRRRRSMQRIIWAGFVLCVALSLAWSAVNVEVVKILGRPLNYPWLYYSDFLKSHDALQAIRAGLGRPIFGVPAAAWHLLGLYLVLFILAWALWAAGKHLLPRRLPLRTLVPVIAIFASSYVIVGHLYLQSHHWPRGKLMNPTLSFFVSVLRAQTAPPLFTMETSVEPDDFIPIAERKALNSSATGVADAAGIENVILFVLESVSTGYLEIYGGPYSVSPNLLSQRPHALVVNGIYAPSPATNFAMLSLLTSTYPQVSYQALTREHPDLALASLSDKLHRLNYRTGFFYSADLSYQNSGEFLSYRSFDNIEDHRQRECGDAHFGSEEWSYLDSSDDLCTCESLIRWIDDTGGHPFFAVLWTGMTHYPYFFDGEEQDYGAADPYLNRYLNALRRGDEALGHLLGALEERGILDSTLVVLVGDHGEAFGQHGTYGHASGIYEENVHVPMVLINRRLFGGEELSTVGGLIDVGPTILDLLGLSSPGSWQGQSIFSAERPPRYYFFAPWSELLFGFREGNQKVIFNATRSAFEVYDLDRDPGERSNIAAEHPALVSNAKHRLAAWVQFQQRLFAQLLAQNAAEP